MSRDYRFVVLLVTIAVALAWAITYLNWSWTGVVDRVRELRANSGWFVEWM